MRLAVAAIAMIVAGCSQQAQGPAPPLARVVTVIDGDTVVIQSSVHRESVRLIGIDTPEVAHHGDPDECHGPESARRLSELLPTGSIVSVSRDVEARDVYGRLLAYLTTPDGTNINLLLASEGAAETLTIAPNLGLADQISEAAAAARAQGLGLWGQCSEAQ